MFFIVMNISASFEKVNSTPKKVGVEITFANQIKVCAGI